MNDHDARKEEANVKEYRSSPSAEPTKDSMPETTETSPLKNETPEGKTPISSPPSQGSQTTPLTKTTAATPAFFTPATNGISEGIPTPPPSKIQIIKTHSSQHKGSSTPTASNVDQARKELDGWIKTHKLGAVDAQTLKILLKDHDALKEKIPKLKSLLGRSAKAQREAKVDLDATQKRLDSALREIARLKQKIDKLANRPTHMELLADFETNFDRALLSVGHGQTGGEDTAPPTTLLQTPSAEQESAVVDNLLMQEVAESKKRILKLESLNATLLHQSSLLESEAKESQMERDELKSKVTHLELEKRMAEMEAEHAVKAMQEKAASLEEMQMEIDLVTKASVKANIRASHGEKMIETVKSDKQHVQELEAKVQALQEWATASAETKALAQERVQFLENQLKVQQQKSRGGEQQDSQERILFSTSGSLVIGAGDVGVRVVQLEDDQIRSVGSAGRVVLRWKFDSSPSDMNIDFNVLKGACEKNNARNADHLIKDRAVTGGAAGETDDAFATKDKACTLLWSNAKSWIRPRTVKYSVDAVALLD